MNTTRKTVLKALFGVPLVAGLGTAAVMPGLRDAELARARAEGIPTEPADLRPNPPIPPEQNAGPILTDLARQIGTLPANPLQRAPTRRGKALYDAPSALLKAPDDPDARAAFAAMLRRYGPLVAQAERAAALPRCDFGYDWSLGPRLEFSDLEATRNFARIFAARALTAESARDAAADIARAARLGNLVAQTPSMFHAEISVAIHAVADDALLQVAQRHGSDIAALTTFAETLKAFAPAPDPTFALGGEVVLERAYLQQMRRGRPADDGEASSGAGSGLSGLAFVFGPAWDKQILVFWREAFALLRSTDDPQLRQTRYRAMMRRWRRSQMPQDLLIGILMPIFDHFVDRVQIGSQVRRDLRETAIELLLRRAADGEFPAHRDTPIDLYSGKPLVYRRDGDDCLLYSVGPDRTDDGGAKKGKTNAPYDLVVRLHLLAPAPEMRPADPPARAAAMAD